MSSYFDPLGETEPHTTLYTITVYIPPRPLPHWLPAIFSRTHNTYPNTGAAYMIRPDDTNPDLDCFELKHLPDLPTKRIKIKSAWFPPEMRCKHITGSTKVCEEGCYFLEKGGDRVSRSQCKRSDCEGHVYCNRVKSDDQGRKCFGEKGKRMVCLEL